MGGPVREECKQQVERKGAVRGNLSSRAGPKRCNGFKTKMLRFEE